MRYRFSAAMVAVALPLAACSGAPDAGSDETAALGPGASDGSAIERPSARVPFLGGAFVTWAESMPVEVEQAVAGRPTDRPVVVWAGLDAAHADGAATACSPGGAEGQHPAQPR
ncbi:MAG: hypothetical protein WKG00_41755 [Polyangiaceae bacterium]